MRTLLIISVFIFALQKLIPGDVAIALAGEGRNADVIAHVRAKYRMDQPVLIQYFTWLGAVWDYSANIAALSGLSIPNFWPGIILILVVSVHLDWLPASGIAFSSVSFGEFLAGAVLTEQIFSIRGLGKLIVDAVFNRDFAAGQGVVLLSALVFLIFNMIADLAPMMLNPRPHLGNRLRVPLAVMVQSMPGTVPGAASLQTIAG